MNQDKDTEILNADLSVIGCVLVVMFLMYIYIENVLHTKKLNQELYQAKEYTVYYYNRADSMENSNIALNEYINSLEVIIAQKDQLDAETAKLKRIILELRLSTQKKTKK